MRLTVTILVILMMSLNIFAADEATISHYQVDVAKSSVNWKGTRVGGEHVGMINLKSAKLIYTGDVLSAGNFVIDMTSLKNTDIEKIEERSKLEKHLKSEDFFKTEEFPESSFEFTNVKDMGNGQYAITGQMTIKKSKNQETFMIKVNLKDDELVAVSDLKVDRTKYGIMYKANKSDEDEWFFTKWFKGGQDKLIDNTIEIRLNIFATKQYPEE